MKIKKKPTTTGADRAEARFRKMLEDGVKRCGPIPALVASRQSARCFARKQAKRAFRKLVAGKAAAQMEAMRRVRAARIAAFKKAAAAVLPGETPLKFSPLS